MTKEELTYKLEKEIEFKQKDIDTGKNNSFMEGWCEGYIKAISVILEDIKLLK